MKNKPSTYVISVIAFGETQHVENVNADEFSENLPRAAEAIVKHH